MMKNKKIEFSKVIMAAMVLSYFVGLIFGIIVIVNLFGTDNGSIYLALGSLFGYIGAPVAVAVGFYSNKAKAENIEKIRYNGTNSEEQFVDYRDEYEDLN